MCRFSGYYGSSSVRWFCEERYVAGAEQDSFEIKRLSDCTDVLFIVGW